jgi:hypothetical protein
MSDFTMARAKSDFQRGFLKEARIIATLPATWAVQITSKLGMDGTGFLVDARHKQPRQMRSLDAAVEAVMQIGFDVKRILIEQ